MQSVPVKSTSSWFHHSTVSLLQANLLVGLFYLLFVGLIAQAFSGFAPVWPSAAVAMFAVLIGGWRWLPGIAIASWLGNNLFLGWSTEWSLWMTLGNVLGPLVASLVLRRFIPDTSLTLESGRGVALFSIVAALSGTTSACFGAFAAVSALPPASFNDVFFSWLVRDFTAVLMLTPAFVLWWKDSRSPCQLLRGDPEMWLATTTLIIMTAVLFFIPASGAESLIRIGILSILLPLVWVALRFPQRTTFTLMSFIFILSILGTWMDRGVISQFPEPFTRLQIILIAKGMITLLVSAMSLERRRVLDALSMSYNTLEERVNERTQQLTDNLKHLKMLLDNVPVPISPS